MDLDLDLAGTRNLGPGLQGTQGRTGSDRRRRRPRSSQGNEVNLQTGYWTSPYSASVSVSDRLYSGPGEAGLNLHEQKIEPQGFAFFYAKRAAIREGVCVYLRGGGGGGHLRWTSAYSTSEDDDDIVACSSGPEGAPSMAPRRPRASPRSFRGRMRHRTKWCCVKGVSSSESDNDNGTKGHRDKGGPV
ncbi:hypothetical protein CORC01_13676 [Colletotrichum orchidophilum]|uniref:Uncharacterized protein n=1 Tax=Colletotrichum orchidophilum TaxID=1209926 RepID=A0A1G4APQ5_9PEZI|nr:uncharacterized protein CORC01_13676 [Colletotrichum orchidophilum]OHE91022.1 hypothetical protein CORC01_13676 [Colletotrichum orchidophilum]